MIRGRFLLRAFVDFIGLIGPITGAPIREPKGDKIRVLIFNWRDTRHAYAGGAEVYIHELAKRLVDEGKLVTMFCGSDGRGAPRHENIDGINIIRRGGFYFVYIWAFFYYMLRFKRRYDVIVDCHNGIPFFTPLYTKEPVICIVHHIHQDIFKTQMSKPLSTFACWLEAKLMPRAYNGSQYIAVSPSTKSEMEALGMRGNIKLIYNGVDLANLTPGIKSNYPLVIFLGRLQKYKSVDILLKAFVEVKIRIPNAKLVIAGSGDADEELRMLSHELKIHESVEFKGRVSDTEKRELLQSAWLMSNPSFMEGWGITTIEANACGSPVVGSDVPGLRDSIQDGVTGSLVPYGDVTKLAEVITALLTDNKSLMSLSAHAHSWAQQFTWEESARQLSGLISQQTTVKKMTGSTV